jgi:hypothetical protein
VEKPGFSDLCRDKVVITPARISTETAYKKTSPPGGFFVWLEITNCGRLFTMALYLTYLPFS